MTVAIPKDLKERIDLAIEDVKGNKRIMRSNAYQFAYTTLNDAITLKGLPGCHVHYDYQRLRKHLGRNYKPIIETFEEYEIINVDYTCKQGAKARGYQINTTLLGDEYTTVTYTSTSTLGGEAQTEEIIRDCTIDFEKVQKEIVSFVSSEEVFESIEKDEEIESSILGRVRVYSSRNKCFKDKELKFIHKSVLLDKFYEPDFSLIKQDKRYYYMPLEMYKKMRRQRVLFSYTNAALRFHRKDIHVIRDEKGNRLHTNITNMPSRLLKHVTYSGESFIELDLKNSQWCFLVYCIENPHLTNIFSKHINKFGFNYDSPTYQTFKEHVGNGTLYEYVQESMGLKSRDSAKEMLFEILFGTTRQTKQKRELKRYLPEIVELLEVLKQIHGYKEIPVSLQKIESEIMIDNILYGLHEDGIPALSKHDSILIPYNWLSVGREYVYSLLDNTLKDYIITTKHVTP